MAVPKHPGPTSLTLSPHSISERSIRRRGLCLTLRSRPRYSSTWSHRLRHSTMERLCNRTRIRRCYVKWSDAKYRNQNASKDFSKWEKMHTADLPVLDEAIDEKAGGLKSLRPMTKILSTASGRSWTTTRKYLVNQQRLSPDESSVQYFEETQNKQRSTSSIPRCEKFPW